MDLTSVHIRLLTNALVLLMPDHGWSHDTERTVPRIVPSKLQMFEYTSLTVNCEGFFSHLTEWRVMRDIKSMNNVPCNKNEQQLGACHINTTYVSDSGEYWCETKTQDKRRSERINITITGGGVVLESPVRPVVVGVTVTLRCLGRQGLHQKVDFYKNGEIFKEGENGEMSLYNISESDQGLYRCVQSSESSESHLLRVTAVVLELPGRPVTKGEDVTLFCRDEMAASNYTSSFYKDGDFIGNSSTGNLTLSSVSKTDEGLYTCNTSGHRESEGEWLTVKDISVPSDPERPLQLPVVLVVLVLLLVLVLVLGFLFTEDEVSEEFQQEVIYSIIMDSDENTDKLNGYDSCFWTKVKCRTVCEKGAGGRCTDSVEDRLTQSLLLKN